MFHRLKKQRSSKQIAYAVLIGIGVVFFWRGAWNLMDLYLFPEKMELSSWISLIVGLGILYITHRITKQFAY